MTSFWTLLACAIAMVVAQDLVPGQPIYHYGWYNAVDAGLFIVAALQLRGRAHRWHIAAAFGGAVIVFAGIAAGLMGPDTHMIVGAPGASVRDDDVGGTFVFPLTPAAGPIALQRGTGTVTIGSRRRYAGGFVFWRYERTVVYVDVADARGNHLTITQPSNASFLSPVLLMQQSTTIAGMDVRFDTFAVPAAQKNVKAVLLRKEQTAQLRTDPPILGKPAVLFAVSTQSDRTVPQGIGLVASGQRKLIGGLLLRGSVGTYPAIVAACAPYLPVLIAGLLLFLTGAALSTRYRWRT